MKKTTIVMLCLLLSATVFSQKNGKAARQAPIADTAVSITDSTRIICAADFEKLYIVLGDEISLSNGRKKVFSGSDRELIMQLILEFVVTPASNDYKKKYSK